MKILGVSKDELFASGHRACAGCGCALAVRHAMKAAGKDTIVCEATGCMEVVSSPYPQTAWKTPWIHVVFENAAAVASGVEAALKKLGKKTKVMALAGDGGTFDIGFQALSGAVERGHDFLFLCYDNSAYMNTGVQRSGATPKYAATTTTPAGSLLHGKMQDKKEMPFIMAAHGAYVATANIGYVQDFVKKVEKGLAHKGPAYVQVFSPCVAGWKTKTEDTIDICKKANNSKFYPLYEIEDGVLKMSMAPKEEPIDDFLKMQGRFKHLKPEEIKVLQKWIDDRWTRISKLAESGLKVF